MLNNLPTLFFGAGGVVLVLYFLFVSKGKVTDWIKSQLDIPLQENKDELPTRSNTSNTQQLLFNQFSKLIDDLKLTGDTSVTGALVKVREEIAKHEMPISGEDGNSRTSNDR